MASQGSPDWNRIEGWLENVNRLQADLASAEQPDKIHSLESPAF